MSIDQDIRAQQEANSAYLKMRSKYRAKLADMELIIASGAFADPATKLLHGPRLKDNGGLKVKVPEWENKAPFVGMEETVELQIDPGSGTFSTVASHVFTMPTDGGTYPETFPFDMLIPTNALPDYATCHLRYKLFDFAGDEFDSFITTVICDRLPPYKHDAPKAPVFAGDYLDDVLLPGGGKLSMTIPGYGDWQATDVIAVYLVDEDNIPEDPTTTPRFMSGRRPHRASPIAKSTLTQTRSARLAMPRCWLPMPCAIKRSTIARRRFTKNSASRSARCPPTCSRRVCRKPTPAP
ncbi:hypothetical protein AO361_15005 [Pseudomonas fluorescens]|uniref:hypothetical protein n=1 Tax=Pseudomonas TaxID=286 RepID=UPI00070C8522|nr:MULTISPECIES: hypothetical protein [Pseudomonas]OOQ44419.1 hypothetical protein AO361_15005 [Pseudomonas fluorescens]